MKLLLENRTDVNAVDSRGVTPLHWAAFAGCREEVKLLLENRTDVDVRNRCGFLRLFKLDDALSLLGFTNVQNLCSLVQYQAS
jgi:ankyrin repeat protein